MRKILFSLALILLLFSGCTPKVQPTEPQSIIVEQPTKVRPDLTPAQRIAMSTVAKNLGLSVDKIKLISTKAMDWPDSCLGISVEGVACAEVITPGFQIMLEANGMQMEYHTNQDGTVIRPATVALTWERVGGFAGFCDQLTVYLSGEIRSSTCNNAPTMEKTLVDFLSASELSTFSGWMKKYGVVMIDASDPAGVVDGMTVKLQLNGAGTEKNPSPAAQQMLVQFAQNLYQTMMSR